MLTIKLNEKDAPKVVRSPLSGYFDICSAEIGCSIPEHVRPVRLPAPYCMIVDDSGLINDRPVNLAGSILYGSDQHGSPICGPALILKDIMTLDGPTTVSLNEADIPRLSDIFSRLGFTIETT